jgi:hypothetical protein
MIPAHIINDRRKEQDNSNQIQLEIPDCTLEYTEWMRKRQRDEPQEEPQTVIVIDIY